MADDNVNYFLFPHMTLSDDNLKDLCIFLPRLAVLEITRQARIPEWAQGTLSGWRVLENGELSEQIGSCILGFSDFAKIHGGPGGILGFLSQVFEEVDEPRYKIQEELKGKCPPDLAPERKELLRAALFLEIARELDERELEIESSYVHLGEIEQEFRDILGIDEESGHTEANISPPLAHDLSGMLYMLPKRIAGWFRVFALRPSEGPAVLVSCLPQVIEETLDAIRVECERTGREFSAATCVLGSIPEAGGLGGKRYRSLIEAPGLPELLSGCHRELDDFIKTAAKLKDASGLSDGNRSVQNALEKFCGKCDTPEADKVGLSLTMVENLTFSEVAGLFGVKAGLEAANWPPIFLTVRRPVRHGLPLTGAVAE